MGGEAESVTLPAKPLSAVSLTVKLAVPPAVTDCEAGLAASVKSGVAGALMVSVTVVVRVSEPPTPVIVSVCVPVVAAAVVVQVKVDEPSGAIGLGAKA